MRIGISALSIFRNNKHGIDISAVETILNLQKLDKVNQYFVFGFKNQDMSCLEENQNFRIITIPNLFYPVAEQIFLPFLARKYKLDILHSMSNTAPLLLPCKSYITLHDIIYLEKSINKFGGRIHQVLGNIYRRMIVPSALKNAEKVFTVSCSEKNRILSMFPKLASRLMVTRNACPEWFMEKSTGINQIFKSESYYLIIGNTDPKKNTLNQLKGLKILHDRGLLKYPVVIADLSDDYLEKLINTNSLQDLWPYLICIDYVNHKILRTLYINARALLFVSERESFGMPIIEAMSCGTPVITSSASSMPEIAEEAALYADPSFPESIAGAISLLESSEKLRFQLKAKGNKRCAEFNWKQTASILIESYNTSVSSIQTKEDIAIA